RADSRAKILDRPDGLAIHFHDDVPFLEARVSRRAVGVHLRDHEALGVLLDADAEPGLAGGGWFAVAARPLADFRFVELDRHGLLRAVAVDDHADRRAPRCLRHVAAESLDVVHRLAVERLDDVAALEARAIG